MKRCTGCGQPKDSTEFYKDARRKDGLSIYCKPCWKAKYQTTPEHKSSRAKAVSRHYEKVSKTPEYQEKRKFDQLRYLYRMSQEQYYALLLSQNNACDICQTHFDERVTPFLDHNHACCPGNKSCGKCWRGLLCSLCNQGIGCLKDSPLVIERALAYVKQYAP